MRQVPPWPHTTSLIAFLDLIYAVVFADFIHAFFGSILFGKQVGERVFWFHRITWPTAFTAIVCGAVFTFIAYDWLYSRALTRRHRYRGYGRFFLDLLIAFLSYGALNRAVQSGQLGLRPTLLYLVVILFLGAVWAGTCLAEDRRGPLRGIFRRIAFTHLFTGAVALLALFVPIIESELQMADGWSTSAVALFVWLFLVFEDSASIMYTCDRSLWIGPSAPLFPRAVQAWLIGLFRDLPQTTGNPPVS